MLQNNEIEVEIMKKCQKRDKKKRKKMKVSGAGVKGLQRMIVDD